VYGDGIRRLESVGTKTILFDKGIIVQQRKLLMVAATGGHLTQLVRLAPRFGTSRDSVWVTFDTPQSRSMLRGKETFFVPYISPRDWKGTITAFCRLAVFLRNQVFDGVYSTGAAVALSAFLQPRLIRTPKTYIESVSRTRGPSLSGRMVSLVPGVRLYTQHKRWANRRWSHTESVLAHYETKPSITAVQEPLRIFVTLGTIQPYRFDSLIDAVLATGLAGPETVWQTGVSNREGLPGSAHEQMEADDFLAAIDSADVVITHAGVGTVIQLLELGKSPVVVPREKMRGEHVDDHQFQISALLMERKLGIVKRTAELTAADVIRAANQRTDVHA
jgi:UDP-N-acetylglucosamine--N-acetylmuramyl-(pentapeptide) pyrophosphoryl-undecaprenol N-acetylglucosamine transferase